jgi:hypothetical protein
MSQSNLDQGVYMWVHPNGEARACFQSTWVNARALDSLERDQRWGRRSEGNLSGDSLCPSIGDSHSPTANLSVSWNF